MITGAISAKAKAAHEIEKRIDTVYRLSWDQVVDEELLDEL